MTPELGQEVIRTAKNLVGSHYINGGYGATPGRFDGCPCRPGGVELIADENHLDPTMNATRPVNLAVSAATMNVKSYCVCAGNYTRVGGREAEPTEPDLIAYLGALKGQPPSLWPDKGGALTPRRAFGPGANGLDIGGKLVWAQSCRDKRHFDCVGFISYCYWKASGAVMQLDISAWRTPSPGRQVFDLPTGVPKTLQDGDILVKADHHIAYVSADGTVIQAQDTHIGVTVSAPGAFTPGNPTGGWTHLVRLGVGGSAEQDWPMGWWRVWDGNTYFYYLGEGGVAMYQKEFPFNTRRPPTDPKKIKNRGTWIRKDPSTIVVTWNLVAGAPKPCEETFWNATDGCTQMNANSNLYGPLGATLMA